MPAIRAGNLIAQASFKPLGNDNQLRMDTGTHTGRACMPRSRYVYKNSTKKGRDMGDPDQRSEGKGAGQVQKITTQAHEIDRLNREENAYVEKLRRQL